MRTRVFGLALCAILAAACGSGSKKTPAGGANGTLALQAADMPGVTPCPCQTILKDDAELTALKDALTNGTIVHLDVPYDDTDPDIFRKKCGLEGFWNPALATDEVGPVVTPPTVSSLLQFGNAGICASGFTSASFGTGEGFPVAGTYRKEFKVAHLGTTYHLRLRIAVSGSSAGNTFPAEAIAVPGDIENTLVYEIDGVETPHADLFGAGVAALAASMDDAPSYRLDVRKAAAGPIVFTALVELICADKV